MVSYLVMKIAAYWRRLAFREDRGSMLVEVCVASFVLAVAVIGVMGSMTSSMSFVGAAKQRSAGAQIAQERLERAHNVPYSRIALYEQPVHSTDTTNPDSSVTPDGISYQVDSSTTEPLVVDTTNGALKHIDDPVVLGTTQFNVYQYVTWHDDPTISGTTDYKRVTIVVTWAFPVRTGLTHRIVSSTYIGQAGIIPPAASSPPAPSATPTSSAPPVNGPGNGCTTLGVGCAASGGLTPTPSPNPACGNDNVPPTASAPTMQSGTGTQGFTNSTTVQLQVQTTDAPGTGCWPVNVDLSNDGTNWVNGASISPTLIGSSSASGVVSWQVGAGDGRKGFYVRFRDAANNCCGGPAAGQANYWEVDYTLDRTLPSPTPANVRRSTCAISGSNRSATFTWDPSSDTNFVGYRVYRSVNSGAFVAVGIPTTTSFTDTTSKGDLIQYKVRAYDKAGNETPDSNILVFQKQSGSGSTCA